MTLTYDPRNPAPHNLGPTTYDPRKLLQDIAAMLEDRGLTVRVDESPEAASTTTTALYTVLRGLGLQAGSAPEDWLDLDGGARYNARVHGD